MYQLRPYQQTAVQNAVAHFQKSREPALIVLPTGAGKSLVIAELARIAKGRVLVLAHVKELVEQNYKKFISYGIAAGIYSAGLNQKDSSQKVIFGSIQSVANAEDVFFDGFALLIIDECHRVSDEGETQYGSVIEKLRSKNHGLCILGLTATPYRLGMGWIYECDQKGIIRTQEKRFWKSCLFDLPLEYMIKNKYLTRPVRIDIPVTSYDFSELTEKGRMYTISEVEDLLKRQKRLTPLIIKNIVDIAEKFQRKGVMIFSATVRHAEEILSHLPAGEAQLVIGDTEEGERDRIINQFKEKKFKYLVNVSVLTTGFDAPHVDVIAILRPTESLGLYQQIIGRGLRLDEGKTDCLILDYTGMGHDIYAPEIGEKKPTKESVAVEVECPCCGFANNFWGVTGPDGELIEHFGRKCRGAIPQGEDLVPCGYRFRAKFCNKCGAENDVTARQCIECGQILVDADTKLKEAKLSKNAHVFRPESVKLSEAQDKNGKAYLNIKYFDADSKYLTEIHYLDGAVNLKKFSVNFLRSHMRRPELTEHFTELDQVIKYQKLLRVPIYLIARKQEKFWKITEKIFVEEL